MNKLAGLLSELARTFHEAQRALRLLSFYQRLALTVAIVLMAVVGYCTAKIPLLLGGMVDAMLSKNIRSLAEARHFLVGLALIFIVRELFQVLRKITVERTCTTVERDATIKAVCCLLAADLSMLGAERAGTLNGRLHRSVQGLVRLLKLSFLDLFPAAFGAVFALFAAVNKNVGLGLAMAGIVPIGLFLILAQMSSQRGIRISLLRAKEKVDGTVVEQIGGIENVRAAHTLDHEIEKVSIIADELRRKELWHHIAMSFFDALKSLNEGVFHIVIITFAISLALSGKISSGDILAFSILFGAVVNPLREIHRIMDEAHESGIKAGEFFAMLDQPRDHSFNVQKPLPLNWDNATLIEAKALNVAYGPTNDGGVPKLALRGISLSVRDGEVIGFAGPSGSGKTTFVRALLRLVHPVGGELRVGNVPINQITREEIGRTFGFVSQTPFLFAGSIAENIAYGCPSATTEAIAHAARQARIADQIEALPGQYDYAVTERGGNLSGGQRQRIALARVFLQNPPVLILDEATAALDNENERAVMDAISNAVEGRTVLMVAHRLSSLQRADRIYVFKDGEIAEVGSYAELSVLPRGVFSALLFGRKEFPAISPVAASCREETLHLASSLGPEPL